jgi:hypothetical protein
MTKYGAHDDMNEWEDYGDVMVYSFFVSEFYESDPVKDKNCFKTHLLLEFLDYLKVIEYSKGYEGAYYDIVITKRKR